MELREYIEMKGVAPGSDQVSARYMEPSLGRTTSPQSKIRRTDI